MISSRSAGSCRVERYLRRTLPLARRAARARGNSMSEQQRPERTPRKNGRPQPGGPNGGGPGGGGMRFGRGLFGWVLFIGLAVMLFIVLQSNKKSASEVSISELQAQADNQKIAELIVDNEVVRGRFIKPVQIGNNPNAVQFRCEIPAAQVASPWYMGGG